jgi:hypothetical protein
MARAQRQRDEGSFLLQRAHPAMTSLIDGSLSTLAPIFAVAFATAPAAACVPRRAGDRTGFVRSFLSITLGGAIIATVSAALGALS